MIFKTKYNLGLTTIVEYMVKFIHSTGCESDKWFNSNLFYKTKKELVESL